MEQTLTPNAPQNALPKMLKLTERQRAIVEWIREHPNTTYDELAGKFGVSRQSIYKDIKKLKKGVIHREGDDSEGEWKLSVNPQ